MRAHLAQINRILGPPPPGLLARAAARTDFFSENGLYHHPCVLRRVLAKVPSISGDLHTTIAVPPPISLEELETNLEGTDKVLFLKFMRKMLQWDPKDRYTAKQLLDDEWLNKHLYTEHGP